MSAQEIFDRVLVGVDGTDYGFEALQQALALAPSASVVQTVTALDLTGVVQTGWDSKRFAEMLERDAEQAREKAAEILADRANASARLVRGTAQTVLRHEIEAFAPTLLALGGRRRSRFVGALLGETASMLLHDATYSVLLARPQWGQRWRPDRVVVGMDGSAWSQVALTVADELRGRLGSELTVVAAKGGKTISEEGTWDDRVTEWDPRPPVDALCDRSRLVDLVVVGSRGLHGVRSLGSVSERVAHRAHSSVLVVHPGSDMPLGAEQPGI